MLPLLIVGCDSHPTSPLASDAAAPTSKAGLASPSPTVQPSNVGKSTRATLNADGKVIGISRLEVAGVRFDVTFTAGGLSSQRCPRRARAQDVTYPFPTSSDAIAAVNAIREFFNTSNPRITPDDVGWDTLLDSGSRGDVVVPYAVTSTDAPFAATGWDAPQSTWNLRGTNTFERDRQLTSAATWAFFTPAKGGPVGPTRESGKSIKFSKIF